MTEKPISERMEELERGFARVLEHGSADVAVRAELDQHDMMIQALGAIIGYVVAALALLGLVAGVLVIRKALA